MLSLSPSHESLPEDQAEGAAPVRSNVTDPQAFGRSDTTSEGWYWGLLSSDIAPGQVKPLTLLGRELAVYRGRNGEVRAVDAHCPHMGAHLAEGKVDDDDNLQCFFHGWTFGADGTLVDIPCQKKPLDLQIKTWPVEERYGLIWIYNGRNPAHGVLQVPDLDGQDVDYMHGTPFEKGCHPNIVMVNAIDEQHFATVHNLPVDLAFEVDQPADHIITYKNTTYVPKTSALNRFIAKFYAGPLTYKMAYQSGTTGCVTIGPDFLNFHIMFCLRPTEDGKAQGQTVLLTNKRKGVWGWLFNRGLLFATKIVGNYFAQGDTRIFESIKWNFHNPIAMDRSIIRFIKHVERLPRVAWGDWAAATDLVPLKRGSEAELEGDVKASALSRAAS